MTDGRILRAGPGVTRTDWETPAGLFLQLHHWFRFTLDAAASKENRKVECYIDEEMDALGPTPWQKYALAGRPFSAFCNPPYGHGIQHWADRMAAASRDGNGIVVGLVPSSPATRWWKRIYLTASEVWLLDKRVPFELGGEPHDGNNTAGSCIPIWRPEGNSGHALVTMRQLEDLRAVTQ